MIRISDIRRDGETQSRAAIHEATVADYAEAMADPDTVFPPVTVYHDGQDYWLADGFHRVAAWERLGRAEIPAEVKQDDRRRAILHSVQANACHGLRRSNEDKRRAVQMLLEDAEWSHWSDREIAKRVRVSHPFVARVRDDITNLCKPGNVTTFSQDREATRTYKTKHGTATMDTANIGAKPTPDSEPKTAQELWDAHPPDWHPPPPSGPGWPTDQDALDHSLPEYAAPEAEAPPPEDAAPEDPATAKLRREYRSLTAQAQEDDWIGMRAQIAEQKRKITAHRDDIDKLKSRIKELTEDNQGRVIGNLQRRLDQSEGRSKEYQANAARLQRQVNAQKAEIARLRKSLENQEVEI